MSKSSFLKICTAAIAGSIIGISYERFAPIPLDWTFPGPQLVAAWSRTNNNNNLNINNDKLDQISPAGKYSALPETNPKVSAEFFKASSKYGLPSKDNLRLFNDYILSYDRRLRSPNWVMEHITPDKLEYNEQISRNNSRFLEDPTIHEYFRAKHNDFTNTGFDRGHMAAAANHKANQEDLDQTFALSNISPQVPEFNRGGWEKLERYVRYLAKRSKNLYVVTGPLYVPMKARDGNLYVTYRVLGNNHISVPTHYYKVILYEIDGKRMAMEAFMMPNDQRSDERINLNDYRIPIDRLDTIERAAGVIFFDQLPRKLAEQPLALPSSFRDDRNIRKRVAPKAGSLPPPSPPGGLSNQGGDMPMPVPVQA